jgi:hypothetical protein
MTLCMWVIVRKQGDGLREGSGGDLLKSMDGRRWLSIVPLSFSPLATIVVLRTCPSQLRFRTKPTRRDSARIKAGWT